MWMNEGEIDEAVEIVGKKDAQYLPYVQFLSDWRHVVNQNSDGWPYWTAASRAAGKLMVCTKDLVEWIRSGGSRFGSVSQITPPTHGAFGKALSPIRRLATLKKLPAPELKLPGAPLKPTDMEAKSMILEVTSWIRAQAKTREGASATFMMNMADLVQGFDIARLRP